MDVTETEALGESVRTLEDGAEGARAVIGAFNAELRSMQATVSDTGRDVRVLSRGISTGLRRAFDGLVFDGMKLSDALKGVAEAMVNAAYSAAITPVTKHVGGLLARGIESVVSGLLPFEKGAPFSQGRVVPFASGGIVRQATTFPMRGATGLMGEAGPEAIMPLTRGADGRLGVQASGGRAVHVTINVSTPDVEGFRRSQSQIAAQMNRALARGQRNR
ncbi:phage tail tape measure protein [Rhodobacteraceae bacterium CCMM004]|nr:phage tail tape measure protein [Rhodobacteraceae bacterium CCMM004]